MLPPMVMKRECPEERLAPQSGVMTQAYPGVLVNNIQRVHVPVLSISDRTYFNHQSQLLHPTILWQWKCDQTVLLQQAAQDGDVFLGGDMRADTPGHCAKYGSYTMMDLKANRVIDLQLVQIQKFLREEKPAIQHFYDVWHVAKGIAPIEGYSYLRYIETLQELLFERVVENPEPGYQELLQQVYVPPPLCSQYDRPDKSEAVARHMSRFAVMDDDEDD
ncbi:hypothetical protein SKAU_G00060900 [Synaphobranchus kaupii]|uniref:Uncharacterized protein n=1 Tax=Synaphobranchus kaupii TaxID=118154 RepID=A0A9Q1JAQ9_SYNKA|nr:hypothetical protein SKAU_G00060900 [Synaphobranchus kaupii]